MTQCEVVPGRILSRRVHVSEQLAAERDNLVVRDREETGAFRCYMNIRT